MSRRNLTKYSVTPVSHALPRPGRRKATERVLRSGPWPRHTRQGKLTTGRLTGRYGRGRRKTANGDVRFGQQRTWAEM
jgi:hypothetical protein